MVSQQLKRKITQYCKERLGMFNYKRGWLKGTCPICQKPKKFGVHISNNRTNCFVCGYNKSPLDLIVELEVGVSNRAEAMVFLKVFEGADYLETPQEMLPEVDGSLPKEYNPILLGDGKIAKAARKYLINRGFDLFDLSMQGVGYCAAGKYAGRIIIPYYEAGKIVYFNARKFMFGGTKFDNPIVENFGTGKSLLIYNVDALEVYQEAYVVESATNALTLGPQAIAGGGKHFSAYQVSKLLQSKIQRFIIILDPDAVKEAIRLAFELVNHKKVRLVILPEKLYLRKSKRAISKVDVNEIGRDLTLKFCGKCKDLNLMDLLTIKMEYEKRAQLAYN